MAKFRRGKYRYYRGSNGAIVGFRSGYDNAYKTGARIVKSGKAKGFKVVRGPMGSQKLLLKR